LFNYYHFRIFLNSRGEQKNGRLNYRRTIVYSVMADRQDNMGIKLTALIKRIPEIMSWFKEIEKEELPGGSGDVIIF
jgi:hypothetical protein